MGEYTNWVGGVLPASTNVARFQLDDQQAITASESTYTGGFVFEPAALEQGEEAPESYQWWLSRQDNKDVYWTSTNPLGYFPLCVSGGTLVIGSNCALYPNDYGPVRKEGDGTITLPEPQAVGNWEIARGTSVVDAGSGDLNERWSVSNAWETHTVKFAVSSGAFRCRVYGSGSLFFVR